MPIFIDKPKGLTPLELVKKYKKDYNIKDKVCYAGRLDPMAHGKMILLKGIECKEMTKYCNLNKTYHFTVLFGFETDTYDLLGKVDNSFPISTIEKISLKKYVRKFKQPYPSYSSFIIRHNEERRPIWEWTKMGKLSELSIPSKEVEIFSLEEIENEEIIDSYIELEKYIFKNINLLSKVNHKKFRVEEILEKWEVIFKEIDLSRKPIIKKFSARVSSGTYIRSLTNQIGKEYGFGAITLDIERVNIEI